MSFNRGSTILPDLLVLRYWPARYVVDDGLVAPLVGNEVDVVSKVFERRERDGVLQAGHARRLRPLEVVLEVVHHHVHRRRRPVRLAVVILV